MLLIADRRRQQAAAAAATAEGCGRCLDGDEDWRCADSQTAVRRRAAIPRRSDNLEQFIWLIILTTGFKCSLKTYFYKLSFAT